MRPCCATVWSMSARTSSTLLTSHWMKCARPGPRVLRCAATASPSSGLRAQKTTFEPPSSTNVFTQPKPNPFAAAGDDDDFVFVAHGPSP